MIVRELLTKVRDKLQDTDSIYWSDSELIELYNECKRYLASERKESPATTTLSLLDNTNEYTLEGVLRYISIKDSEGLDRKLYPDDGSGDEVSSAIIVQDYNKIYVNTPEDGVILNIKHIAFPSEDTIDDTIRSGDEESFNYFILAKAYEKDNDMEQFQKASYFWNMFLGAMKNAKKNSSLNYIEKVQTIKSYFY